MTRIRGRWRSSEQQGEDSVDQVKRFELIQEIGAKVDLTVRSACLRRIGLYDRIKCFRGRHTGGGGGRVGVVESRRVDQGRWEGPVLPTQP